MDILRNLEVLRELFCGWRKIEPQLDSSGILNILEFEQKILKNLVLIKKVYAHPHTLTQTHTHTHTNTQTHTHAHTHTHPQTNTHTQKRIHMYKYT